MSKNNFYETARHAMKTALGENVNPELVTISVPGSSGSRVSIFRHPKNGTLYAVKCVVNPRVSMQTEVERRANLVPYLHQHLPDVFWCGMVGDTEVLVSQCAGVYSLHQSILSADRPLSRMQFTWYSVLSSLTTVWMETKTAFEPDLCPRHFPTRLARIEQGVRNETIVNVNLAECFDLPVVINGREYPSLSASFAVLKDMGMPRFGVVCQGDPQPSNIVVGDREGWYFVDWEWAGPQQDWRGMVSHLKGWWHSRCLVLKAEPAINITRGRLVLDYDAALPEHLTPFSDAASSLAFVNANASSRQDIQDINRYLGALYFGELRFLNLWGRSSFAVPLLAQAVITANLLGRTADEHPFQFPI